MTRRRRTAVGVGAAVAVGVVVGGIALLSGVGGDDDGSKGASKQFTPDAKNTIVAIHTAYTPTSLHLHVGDAVAFENRDVRAHTFTADGGLWDSRTVDPKGTYGYTLPRAGTFTFHCEIHPQMKGTITVT